MIIDGLAWSWVRSFQPASQGFPEIEAGPTGTDGEQRLRQHVTRLRVSESGNSETIGNPCESPRIIVRAFERAECLSCQGGAFLSLLASGPDPSPTFISPGRFSESASDLVSPLVVSALQDSTSSILMAADERTWSTGPIRGVILSKTGAIESFLTTGANGEIFDTKIGDLAAPRTSASDGSFLAALSGYRQEVAFLERDSSGKVARSLRTFDFDLVQEVLKPLLGNHRLVDPVALTYRAQDDAYYVLDRTKSTEPTATLYRIARGNSLEPVASWARPGKFSEVALTVGTDGTLVVTTWNESSYAVAVVGLDAHRAGSAGPPRVLELRFGRGSVTVPAYRNLDSMTLVVLDGDGSPQPTRLPSRWTPTDEDSDGYEKIDTLSRAF